MHGSIQPCGNGSGCCCWWCNCHTLGPLISTEHCLSATAYLSIYPDHVLPFMARIYHLLMATTSRITLLRYVSSTLLNQWHQEFRLMRYHWKQMNVYIEYESSSSAAISEPEIWKQKKKCPYEAHQFCLMAAAPSQYLSMAGFLYHQHCSESGSEWEFGREGGSVTRQDGLVKCEKARCMQPVDVSCFSNSFGRLCSCFESRSDTTRACSCTIWRAVTCNL